MRHEIEPTLNILSISFLVAFRALNGNGLTELPSGTFNSLALLPYLYVLSLVEETSFVFCLPLELDILFFFFFARLSPARCS